MTEHYKDQFKPADFEPLDYTPEEEEAVMIAHETGASEMVYYRAELKAECTNESLFALIPLGNLADGRNCDDNPK